MKIHQKLLIYLITYSIIASVVPTAVVSASQCNVTATGINFAGYNVFSPSPTTATGYIGVTCNFSAQNPSAVTISLSPGTSGSFAQRRMTNANNDPLNYNVFTDPSYTSVLGDGNGGSTILTNTLTKDIPWNVTYYGRVPANQDVAAGSYTDTLTVTVSW